MSESNANPAIPVDSTRLVARITDQQKWVLEYLHARAGRWMSPTLIGRAYDRRYHSSWASPKCKKLVGLGLLERNESGHYRSATA